ncbi:hypothetical protein ASJ79_16115 [Mycobacterium sp. NAZ190054]|nr:hypothetical protein [Mycobacterium sp. NAZ190054]KWX68846.1 hypothetical protein ASJ79_16115 [Mycobacterium sp. NAZ190054]
MGEAPGNGIRRIGIVGQPCIRISTPPLGRIGFATSMKDAPGSPGWYRSIRSRLASDAITALCEYPNTSSVSPAWGATVPGPGVTSGSELNTQSACPRIHLCRFTRPSATDASKVSRPSGKNSAGVTTATALVTGPGTPANAGSRCAVTALSR